MDIHAAMTRDEMKSYMEERWHSFSESHVDSMMEAQRRIEALGGWVNETSFAGFAGQPRGRNEGLEAHFENQAIQYFDHEGLPPSLFRCADFVERCAAKKIPPPQERKLT